jgi:mycothione reductase
MTEYDLIVIGGGRASNLAVAAGQAGKKVVLIEKDRLGGTCPNRGCVPSKLLIGYAEAARRVREADRHFIEATIGRIDVERMIAETNAWVEGVDGRYEGRLPDEVDLYRGTGRFVDDHVVEVDGKQLTAPQIVIATGTRPRPAPYPEFPVWTSDDIFPLKGKVPGSITIVGGGFIGCELSNFFDAVGVETRLLVRGERLLPAEDADISRIFTEQFSQNVSVDLQTKVGSVEYGDGMFEIQLDKAGGGVHRSEALLFAIGRLPNTDQLGLENTRIEKDQRGFVKRDSYLETTVPGVHAVGDVAGEFMLQHAASYEVHYLRQRLLRGEQDPINMGAMPHAVFSDPEVAAVGLTEKQVTESGRPHVVVMKDWKASARAMSTRLDYPRTKMLVDPDTHEILGCHLIGPEASTMIHEVMMVMRLDNDVRHIKDLIHIHPALPEALLAAAVSAEKEIRRHREENAKQ